MGLLPEQMRSSADLPPSSWTAFPRAHSPNSSTQRHTSWCRGTRVLVCRTISILMPPLATCPARAVQGDGSAYDKNQNWYMHDYFFGKSLDAVRPGGVIAFITSKGTLDKETPPCAATLPSGRSCGVRCRLPNDTFKSAGTKVTSDIIFLQKRECPVRDRAGLGAPRHGREWRPHQTPLLEHRR